MRTQMIINSNEFLAELKSENVDELYDMLELLDQVPHIAVFSTAAILEIYDVLFENRRKNEIYSRISRWLDKVQNRGETLILCDDVVYQEAADEIEALKQEESEGLKEILINHRPFDFSSENIRFKGAESIRCVCCKEDLQKVLLLFCNNINEIKPFVEMIHRIFDVLEFDDQIENSVKRLVEGFGARKQEMLYHLYCIATEIPKLRKVYSGNQEIGSHMTIDCSPERKREIVERQLTKEIGGNKINCELHTKMKKIGDHLPDRIYFCGEVKQEIRNAKKENIKGKIYIYKIEKHVK